MKLKDLTGQKFGRLTVLERVKNHTYKGVYWLCECECGNKKIVQRSNLTAGHVRSCGCLQPEVTSRTRSKQNQYEFKEDYVIGYDVRFNKPFLIDKDDYEKIKDITWTRDNQDYVRMTRPNGGYALHRFVMGVCDDPNIIIDHFNGNISDDRKANLRIVDRSINGLNRDPVGTGKLGVLGVRKRNNRYDARITYQNKPIYIGSFKTCEEAKEARIQYENLLSQKVGDIVNGRR